MITVPTTAEIYESVKTDLKVNLSVTTLVGKTVLNALALVQAAKLKIIYLIINFVYKNIFPDTADSVERGGMLERFGLIKLGRSRNAAIAGEYKITVTGDIGATIPAGTTYKSSDSALSPGKLFTVDIAVTLTSTSQNIDVRALEAGVDAKLNLNDTLQLTAPIADVDSFATVYSIEVEAIAEEDVETYRQKVIESYRIEPQGGSAADFRLWSQDADGVRTSYPYVASSAAYEVNLYVEALPADSTDGNGTPGISILLDVQDVVEFDPDTSKELYERGRRPVTCIVHFLPVIPVAVDIIITDLSNTSFLTAIKTALETFVYDIRPFVVGADDPNDTQKNKLYVSDVTTIIREVIGGAETFSAITMRVGGTIYTLYEFEDENIPYINSVVDSPFVPSV